MYMQLWTVVILPLFPMDLLGHQPAQHLEGQCLTRVTIDPVCWDQPLCLVRLVGVGAQDQLAQVCET